MKFATWANLTCLSMTAALGCALVALHNRKDQIGNVKTLAAAMPRQLGRWQQMAVGIDAIDPNNRGQDETNGGAVYDQILNRVYFRKSDGAKILLTLAYRRSLSQENKIHRPELCYQAQGFDLREFSSRTIRTRKGPLDLTAFEASRPGRIETVAYVIRTGNKYTNDPWQTRLELMRLSVKGLRPDGVLIRASIIHGSGQSRNDEQHTRQMLADFVMALRTNTEI